MVAPIAVRDRAHSRSCDDDSNDGWGRWSASRRGRMQIRKAQRSQPRSCFICAYIRMFSHGLLFWPRSTQSRLRRREFLAGADEERPMEVPYPKCAGLDVHKDNVVASARIAIDGNKATQT